MDSSMELPGAEALRKLQGTKSWHSFVDSIVQNPRERSAYEFYGCLLEHGSRLVQRHRLSDTDAADVVVDATMVVFRWLPRSVREAQGGEEPEVVMFMLMKYLKLKRWSLAKRQKRVNGQVKAYSQTREGDSSISQCTCVSHEDRSAVQEIEASILNRYGARHVEAMRMFVDGYAATHIAKRMNVSDSTVSKWRQDIVKYLQS